MQNLKRLLLALVAFFVLTGNAIAGNVEIYISISKQKMYVISEQGEYEFLVSTARSPYKTPLGTYKPTIVKKMHYSSQYNNAPMPYSIFFNRGIAIHGTRAVHKLGKKASHGCVRLRIEEAKIVYDIVRKNGKENTTIMVIQ